MVRDDSGLAAPLLRIVSDRTPDEFGPGAVEEHIVPLVRNLQPASAMCRTSLGDAHKCTQNPCRVLATRQFDLTGRLTQPLTFALHVLRICRLAMYESKFVGDAQVPAIVSESSAAARTLYITPPQGLLQLGRRRMVLNYLRNALLVRAANPGP